MGHCAVPIIEDMAQQYQWSISGSETSDPQENIPMSKEDARFNKGGFFKPTESSSGEEMDSPDNSDRETPMTATEQQREDSAGATTTRRFPHARWIEQEAPKRTDRPRSGKSVA
ncbi:hypothetical protein NDU88_002775 [Pleurodeles waltl]|uniref:Uncharacterized protein n=1 Tax=Pleurodeles waltl TaxID=8319 RepID=A0AAV7L4F9_PLEWA|nr:hypothetical protein NDU88_002775 [Pleurodeles waltl]